MTGLKRIIRHTLPGKFDAAEFGTIAQVNIGEDERVFYIQLSETDDVQWEPIGYLLENAFEELLQDEEFIHELLVLVGSVEKNFEAVTEILKNKVIKA